MSLQLGSPAWTARGANTLTAAHLRVCALACVCVCVCEKDPASPSSPGPSDQAGPLRSPCWLLVSCCDARVSPA